MRRRDVPCRMLAYAADTTMRGISHSSFGFLRNTKKRYSEVALLQGYNLSVGRSFSDIIRGRY